MTQKHPTVQDLGKDLFLAKVNHPAFGNSAQSRQILTEFANNLGAEVIVRTMSDDERHNLVSGVIVTALLTPPSVVVGLTPKRKGDPEARLIQTENIRLYSIA